MAFSVSQVGENAVIISEYICGRKANKMAFSVSQVGEKVFVVGAYFPKGYNKPFYSDPVFIGNREKYRGPGPTKCAYRIIVKPKGKPK